MHSAFRSWRRGLATSFARRMVKRIGETLQEEEEEKEKEEKKEDEF